MDAAPELTRLQLLLGRGLRGRGLVLLRAGLLVAGSPSAAGDGHVRVPPAAEGPWSQSRGIWGVGGGGEGLEAPPGAEHARLTPRPVPDGHGEHGLLPPLGLQLVELQQVLLHAAGELGAQAPNEHAAGAERWRWGQVSPRFWARGLYLNALNSINSPSTGELIHAPHPQLSEADSCEARGVITHRNPPHSPPSMAAGGQGLFGRSGTCLLRR